jgi:hypothetical protein
LDEMPYKGGHGPLLFIDLSSGGGGGWCGGIKTESTSDGGFKDYAKKRDGVISHWAAAEKEKEKRT